MKRSSILLLMLVLTWATPALAANDCVFIDSGQTRRLTNDCTTDAPIVIPDGFTLDLDGHTITAVDPPGDHFRGGVVQNGGAFAAVRDGVITTSNLANVCDAGLDGLRGILFNGASGFIRQMAVTGINQGASGCQEGDAIEVRNCDGAPSVTVEISHNTVTNWQKTGIEVDCNVTADVHHNVVGASVTQANLAANSIQIAFDALGSVSHNHVAGNSWCCSPTVATAVLLFQPRAGTEVSKNNIMEGNADVGIAIFGDGVTVDNNRVFESGPDNNDGFDVGIGDYFDIAPNLVTNNKVRGYDTPYDGVVGGKNKVIPDPHAD